MIDGIEHIGRRIRSTLLLAVLAVPNALFAQTGDIVGHVTDQEGQPLPGVNVVVTSTPLGAATGADGFFRIRSVPSGLQTVAATAIGYGRAERLLNVEADVENRVDFSLSEVAIQSGEVVVTASRREQLTASVAASMSTMTPTEIEARNAVTLDDALRYVPGVQLAGNQVSIRGSSGFSYNTGSRVLLLLDGLPMLRPDANGIPFDAIPMEQVRRIEVLKGPGSALYGGGALGGVVNVITADYPDTPETTFAAYGGAYQPARYELWRRQWDEADRLRPFGGFALGHARPVGPRAGSWVHVSYRYDAGHLRLNRKQNLQAFTKWSWRPRPDARFYVLAGANRRKSDSFLFWNGARDALNPGRIEFGRETGSEGADDNLINELSLLSSYSQVLSPRVLGALRARLFGVLIQPLDESGAPKPLSRGTTGFRYGGEAQVDYSPAQTRHITAGLTGDANATRSSFFDEEESLSQPEGAAFVQWEEEAGERVTLSAGARFDVYRVRKGVLEKKLSPKLSAAVAISDRWIVRGAFGDGFRVPSVAERFISTSDYLPVVANLDLRPETSRSYELGVRGFPDTGITHLSLSVDAAAFWTDYRRLVEPTFVAEESAFQFVNLTRARIRGIEVNVDAASPSGQTVFRAGYTLLDATDLTADRPLVFRSKHLLKLSGSGAFGPVEWGADYRYASAPETVDSDFALFIKDAHMMVSAKVLDVRVSTTWRSIQAALHVKNAFDYYYVERPALLAPPRHFILRLSSRL